MLVAATTLITIAALSLDDDARFLVAPNIEFPSGRPTTQEAESESHSYPFTADQLRVLGQMVRLINETQGQPKYAVVGHTDNIECSPHFGPPAAGFDTRGLCGGLALHRVAVVVWKLIELGADRTKILQYWPGDGFPIAPNDSEENRARNRVVQFVDESKKELGSVVGLAPPKLERSHD